MYVRTESFGRSECSGCGTQGLGSFGIDAGEIAAALAPCALLITRPEEAAICVWNQIQGIIMASPEAEALLEFVVSNNCPSVMSRLGLSSASSLVCALGGSIWTRIQGEADAELIRLTYERGEDRPAYEGGGHTLVDASGSVVGILCPAYRTVPEFIVGPDVSCPTEEVMETETAPGTTPKTAPLVTPLYTTPFRREAARTLPPGRITGTVVDADGLPVAGASIRVGSMSNRPTATTGSSGSFTVSTVPTSNTRIFVSAPGYEDKAIEHIALVSGGAIDTGAIQMELVETGTVGTGTDREKGEGAAAWYSSPWVVVGGLVLAGAVGYGVYRYTR